MTFKEAKKILKKEGFYLIKFGGPSDIVNDPFSEYESPEIFDAGKVVNSAGYGVGMHGEVFNERKARLKKEYEENTKAPGPGEEQTKEKKGIIYPTTFPKADFYHKYFLNEGYSALRESAYQFNDALLDEQAKKIAELTNEKENCCSRISYLEYCIKRNNRVYLRGINGLDKEIKRLGKEIVRLNNIIHKKNDAIRLSKIREKNLAELGLKYVGENEKLKKELADKVVDKIDAQALKSAESALAWKEKTIAEKDEVIADLGKELAATKKELEEKTKRVEVVRNASKEYCEYGVAANEFIKKLANLYVTAGNKGTISNEMFERCKNYQTYGFPATCNKETKKEIDDIARRKENKKPRIHTPEISEEELMKIQEKVVVSCDIAEEGGDYSATIVQCGNGITLSKEESEIIERCTKNGTELHYSEKDGLTYTNMFGEEKPIRCLRGMFHVFSDEEIKNMKK